jgi:hypothetical protein
MNTMGVAEQTGFATGEAERPARSVSLWAVSIPRSRGTGYNKWVSTTEGVGTIGMVEDSQQSAQLWVDSV